MPLLTTTTWGEAGATGAVDAEYVGELCTGTFNRAVLVEFPNVVLLTGWLFDACGLAFLASRACRASIAFLLAADLSKLFESAEFD